MNTCTQCSRSLPVGEFPWKQKAKGIRHKHCKQCQRDMSRRAREKYGDKYNEMTRRWRAENREEILARERERWHSQGRRFKKYGITEADYLAAIEASEGKCPICQEVLTDPVIDHDHETGLFRGVLCRGCNASLGHFKDSLEILGNALDYLRR